MKNRFNIRISFPNGLRADRMDEELIDLLKEAGTYRIHYAVETASPRLQKLIRKNMDLNRLEEIVNYTADKGIMTFGEFMLGFPTETEEEMKATLDYALHSRFNAAHFFYVNPYPGTKLSEKYLNIEGREQALEEMGYFNLKINLSAVPDETLRGIMRECYRRFYFSPSRMWRAAHVVPLTLNAAWSLMAITALAIRDKKTF
ncbi:MAG: radical SAM protein [Dehalococcoidia bacterium]